MFTPTELIHALRRRAHRSIRPLPGAEEFSPGWKTWFEPNRESVDPARGAELESLVQALARREPSPRPAPQAIGGLKAFLALWRDQWEPAGRDERGLRVASRTLSGLLHVLFLVMMSILMHARFMLAEQADAQRGEHVIEVEFIGSGTPEEEGGGAPPDAVAAAAEAPAEPEPLPPPEPEPASEPAPPEPQPAPEQVAEAEPAPEPPAEVPPPPEQSVVVTETPLPDGPFQLPPVPPVEVAPVRTRDVEVAPRTREIELAQTREMSAPQARVTSPDLATPEVAMVERELALPPQALPAPEIPAREIQAPELPARDQQARVRDVPMPPAARPGEATEEMPGRDTGAADDSATASTPASEPQEAGAGPAQVQRDGGWSTPQRDDDWGASTRDRPGGQGGTSSLFNPDGSARLPGEGRVGGGLPPGTITEDYENIDRMGTWLRRPPTDYEPTSFERFWVPHENLLEEWVRRSVRTVLIPIPGTNRSIRCNVATLAFSGGCDIVNPDMQDNPASARPPPDVPFRPELHEDQEGLSDDVWDRPAP